MDRQLKQQLLQIAKPYPLHKDETVIIDGCKFRTEMDAGWVLFVYKDDMDKNYTWYNQPWTWAVNPNTKEVDEA